VFETLPKTVVEAPNSLLLIAYDWKLNVEKEGYLIWIYLILFEDCQGSGFTFSLRRFGKEKLRLNFLLSPIPKN
jgi:hypothetical protein